MKKIREYKESDYAGFKEMLYVCFTQDYKIPLNKNQLEDLCLEITQQFLRYILSIDLLIIDDAPKGFVIYQIDSKDSDWCEKEGYGFIRELYVAADLRGAGHGRSLVSHAEKRMKDKAVPGIYLTTDETTGFWAKIGYRDTGEICVKNNGRIFVKKARKI